jgi:hypothetical protein
MKKILLSLFVSACFLTAKAQTDSLQEYTGKYKFPEGSPVSEIGIVAENGTLTGTSAMGNSEFKKTDTKDVFEVVAYGGTATFKRNAEGKIATLLIQVQDITMEGTKTEGIFFDRPRYAFLLSGK